MSVLTIFSLAFAGAAVLYVVVLPFWVSVALFTLAVGGAIAICYLPKLKGKHLRLIAIGVALGLLWCFVYELWQIRPLKDLEGEKKEILLVAIEDGEPTDYGTKVLCRYGNVRTLVYLDRDGTGAVAVRVGDEIRMTAMLEAVSVEEDLYYIAKDIGLIAYQEGDISLTPGEKTLQNLPQRLYSKTRERILELFPQDTEAFSLALLTGDTGKLSYGVRNQMSLAGISHVVAVSGMHVSLICSLVLSLCLRKRRLAAGICLGAIWFFGAMLGFSPSVTRAVLMNSVLLIAPLLKREYDSPTALGFALLVLLFENPFSVSSAGLQLSFASVGGILLLTQPVTQGIRGMFSETFGKKKGLRWLLSFLSAAVGTTVGASLFTIPLGAYYFETVSLISVVSNVVLLPLITVIFTLGYPLILVSYVLYPIGQIGARILSIPIRWVLHWVQWLGNVPYGALYSRSIYVVLWLVATYSLMVLVLFFRRIFMAVLLSFAMLVSVPFLQKIPVGDLTFTMLDVGQGQCLLAEVGNTVAVIDCGGAQEEASGENTARELLSRGHRKIHALVLTHYDTDHAGGVLQLMSRVKVDCLYLPDISAEDPQREKIIHMAEEMHIPIVWVREDIQLSLDGGTMDIFAPVITKNENDGLCLLLSAADYDILVTGDLSIEGERELLLTKPLPDLEILVAGHHGSVYSTGQELLRYTAPEELLISVGKNSYGHPASQVLERARTLNIRVRRTDQEGTIRITR